MFDMNYFNRKHSKVPKACQKSRIDSKYEHNRLGIFLQSRCPSLLNFKNFEAEAKPTSMTDLKIDSELIVTIKI
jgi:hypothetical protein